MKNKAGIKIRNCIATAKDTFVVDKLNAVEWTVLGVVLLLIFLTLFYGDNLGMFLTYFWINEEFLGWHSIRLLGNNQLSYGLVQQWFCTLWTLPVNLAYRIYKFHAANTVTVLWYKLSMAVVFALGVAELRKIADKIGIKGERCKWMVILFTSTILVALPVFHIAQTDALYMFLMLKGLRSLLEEDRKKFILFFALATSCKTIALIAFVPLLLLYEKRILYIIRDTILAGIILPLERIWYKIIEALNKLMFGSVLTTARVVNKSSETGQTVSKSLDEINGDFFSHFYHKMLYFEFPAARKGYMASTMVFLLVLLCLWCYLQHKEDDELWHKKVIYTVMMSMLIFFSMASPSPYWIVVMYPFVFLVIFENYDCIRTNILLVNAYTWTMFLIYMFDQGHVYGGPINLKYLLFSGLRKADYPFDEGPSVVGYLTKLHLDKFSNIYAAVCIASAMGLAMLNYCRVKCDDRIDDADESKTMHGFVIWQIGTLAVWYLLCVWAVSSW